MANVIKKTTNNWSKGLVMDFSPENTRNEVLTHALNATLLTFNGNELSLLNDMGNGRVETAYLPDGYIPVGTCEYGGIIYIVSYNPLENKSLIGCFPSPERNISSEELGEKTDSIILDDFITENYDIKNISKQVILRNDPLNPGDKFIVTANDKIYEEKLHNLYTDSGDGFEIMSNPFIALNIVSIEDSGKITFLNSNVITYELNNYKYHILGSKTANLSVTKDDIDAFRNVMSSGYSVFKSKISGKLAILAELIMIDSYSVTHKIKPHITDDGKVDPKVYDIILNIETSSLDTYLKYNVIPLLSYYYLENSDGYIHALESGKQIKKSMYSTNDFLETKLSDIYDLNLYGDDIKNLTLSSIMGDELWFPKPKTYHKEKTMLCKAGYYYRFLGKHITDSKNIYKPFVGVTFYDSKLNKCDINTISDNSFVFIKPERDLLINSIDTYQSDLTQSFEKISQLQNEKIPTIHDEGYLLNTTDNTTNIYNELYLASIKIDPPIKDMPLLFNYDYTIVPCMPYGKLNHLAVSNTINFANINDFDRSNFSTWKYRVDGNLLRLTVGTEVYDTFAEHGDVIGIVLEFYDYRGFAGSLIIQNRQSYSGEFTKLINLNSLGALSNKKLLKSDDEWVFTDLYQRNISIEQSEDGTYLLNGDEVTHTDELGWRCAGNTDLPTNDCGTLYSNILYGVKPYFLQKGSEENKYIVSERNQLFLFTSTLLNEYYYSVKNFDLLQDPKLDLILTYKLTDKSDISQYSYGDLSLFDSYTQGIYENTELNGVKYLQYEGLSTLLLEVGLKLEYKDIGLYNLPNINKDFTCTLFLNNDAGDGLYDVKSDISELTSLKDIIGYDPLKETSIQNSILFKNLYDKLENQSISKYTFLSTPDNENCIPINYKFIVGHEVSIEDIKSTSIPATTICALCHKRDDGTYNYEDFGIYEVLVGSEPQYLSDTIIYNAGDSSTETLGLYKQSKTVGTLGDLCYSVLEYSQEAVDRTRPGALGYGKNIEALVGSIGKLTFCLPHAHGSTSSTCGWPNIYDTVHVVNGDHENPKGVFNLGRPLDPEFEYKWGDVVKGTRPAFYYYKIPKYNSCLLTQACVDQYSELISTMEINILVNGNTANDEGDGDRMNRTDQDDFEVINSSEFIGFTGEQLADYNKKLVLTMKSIYAYNPDYDYISVQQGKVKIKDTKCKFTSNLFSKDAKLFIKDTNTPITSLNEYICFGQVPISYYLDEMHKHSKIAVKEGGLWVKQVNFTPDLTYCGGNGYTALLTTLTYNIPIPTLLYDELSYDNSNTVIIKKEDGTNIKFKEIPDKYTLYGYLEDKNSLVQLDVSNYTIANDGTLNLRDLIVYRNTYDITKLENLHNSTIIDKHYRISIKVGLIRSTLFTVYNSYKTVPGGTIYYIEEGNPYLNCFNIATEFWKNPSYKCTFNIVIYALCVKKSFLSYERSTKSDYYFKNQSYWDLYTLITSYKGNLISKNGEITSVDNSFSKKGYFCLGDMEIDRDHYLEYDKPVTIDQGETIKHMNIKITPIQTDMTDYATLVLVDFWDATIEENINASYTNNTIFPVTRKSEYSNYKTYYWPFSNTNNKGINYKQYRILDTYENTTIKDTSITLNDLQYIPNVTGHRLYIKPNLVEYDTNLNNKVYYRYLDMSTVADPCIFGTEKPEDCVYAKTKDRNCLSLFTGPCFTPPKPLTS